MTLEHPLQTHTLSLVSAQLSDNGCRRYGNGPANYGAPAPSDLWAERLLPVVNPDIPSRKSSCTAVSLPQQGVAWPDWGSCSHSWPSLMPCAVIRAAVSAIAVSSPIMYGAVGVMLARP